MKPITTKIALSMIISLGLSACGYNVNQYGASISNVEAIKGQQTKPVAVETFTSSQPGLKAIGCRAAGPVETADETSFETYIQKAFIDELKLAGAYDKTSPIILKGHLKEIDFNSNIGSGSWKMQLAVSTKDKPGYTVDSQYEFSTNWVADKACQQVAQAFTPAVQQLISKIVTDPRFKTLTESQAVAH